MIFQQLLNTIEHLQQAHPVNEARKDLLQPFINVIQEKVNQHEEININFICTHNSRRSHLAQVWAQVASAYFQVPQVGCYSGGTEETALFPTVAETLSAQGFLVFKIAANENPVYAIKYSDQALPLIGFSKKYDSPFNPASAFVAIMTCSAADGACPFVAGAEKRIAITYQDPKIADYTGQQAAVYAERSLEIASEMFYVFSKINNTCNQN